MISIFMVLGVLLITRPPAIFGQDEARRKAGTNETSTFHNMSSDRNNFDHHFISDIVFIKEQNATLYKVPSMRGPYNSPIPLSGAFHPTFQEHLRKSKKNNEDDFSPAQKIIGYISCVAVPFLSALISLITKQCNNQKVPIYVLMLWFGVGASCVIIIGIKSLNVI